jgi:RimJ/RimL family protein N-acetyltransferase
MSGPYGSGQITLRRTRPEDIDRLIAFEQHPDNAPFIRPWSHAQHESGLRDSNIGHFVVCDAASGDIVGHVILVGLENADRSLEFKRIVIGAKGKGLGRDTVRAVEKFTFEDLKFHRLWLEVLTKNDRAKSLYASEGFVEEGIHREALRQGENYHSLIVMSMLAGEYAAQRGA